MVDGNVFHRMNGEVNLPFDEGLLQFFKEKTFATFRRQWHVKCPVALGNDSDQFNVEVGVIGQQQIANMAGLPHRQRTSPGPNPEHQHLGFIG